MLYWLVKIIFVVYFKKGGEMINIDKKNLSYVFDYNKQPIITVSEARKLKTI